MRFRLRSIARGLLDDGRIHYQNDGPAGQRWTIATKVYHVAIDEENRAKEAVRNVAQAESDAIVEVAAELSSGEIMQLGLKAGEVMPVGQIKPI